MSGPTLQLSTLCFEILFSLNQELSIPSRVLVWKPTGDLHILPHPALCLQLLTDIYRGLGSELRSLCHVEGITH